jgi:hypothetical protein
MSVQGSFCVTTRAMAYVGGIGDVGAIGGLF